MGLHIDTDEFITFALRSNIMIKELVEYDKKRAHNCRKRLLNYCLEGEKTLWRLKKVLRLTRSFRSAHHKIYDLQKVGAEEVFGGFTANDISDPRAPYAIIFVGFQALMQRLISSIYADGKEVVLYLANLFDAPGRENKTFWKDAHTYGRAIDVLIEGYNAEESYLYIETMLEKLGINVYLVEYADYVHIQYSNRRDPIHHRINVLRRPCATFYNDLEYVSSRKRRGVAGSGVLDSEVGTIESQE